MSTGMVLAEVRDGVGVVTLNRPERRNALHPDMYDAIPNVLEELFEDPEVGAILLTATGTAFCAGGDVRDGRGRGDTEDVSVEDAAARLVHNARMVLLLHEGPKLSVAALPGPAVGAGMSLALAADFRIAAASARLVPGWSNLAFSGDFGGTWLLARAMGPSRALAALLGNESIAAPAALAAGLVDRVVEDDELAGAAFAWARALADAPRVMARFMKANVRQAERLSLRDALPLEAERMVRSGQTEEHRAAVRRWLDRSAGRGAAAS